MSYHVEAIPNRGRRPTILLRKAWREGKRIRRWIARDLGISKNTVADIVKRHRENQRRISPPTGLDPHDRPLQDRAGANVVFRLSPSQRPDHHPISVNGGWDGTGGIQRDGAAQVNPGVWVRYSRKSTGSRQQ